LSHQRIAEVLKNMDQATFPATPEKLVVRLVESVNEQPSQPTEKNTLANRLDHCQ